MVSIDRNSKRLNWEAVLSAVENTAVREFFEKELAAGRESSLPYKALRYRIDGNWQLSINARIKHAYAWQKGRFHDDLDFWKKHVGDQIEVTPIGHGRKLRFILKTKDEFERFKNAVMRQLADVEWKDRGELDVGEEDEL